MRVPARKTSSPAAPSQRLSPRGSANAQIHNRPPRRIEPRPAPPRHVARGADEQAGEAGEAQQSEVIVGKFPHAVARGLVGGPEAAERGHAMAGGRHQPFQRMQRVDGEIAGAPQERGPGGAAQARHEIGDVGEQETRDQAPEKNKQRPAAGGGTATQQSEDEGAARHHAGEIGEVGIGEAQPQAE